MTSAASTEHDDHDHDREPVGPPPVPPPGPIAQSVAIGFRVVYAVTLLLIVVWLASNIREIPSDSQAVVTRFGRIVRTQASGLLIAWPRPIEQVQLLPGPQRLLSQDIAALPAPSDKAQALIGRAATQGAQSQAVSPYLTGDGNVLVLSASLIYRITDPVAYALAESHVAPAPIALPSHDGARDGGPRAQRVPRRDRRRAGRRRRRTACGRAARRGS
jgi:hypothetical protein